MSLPLVPHAIFELNGRRYDSHVNEGVLVSIRVELTTDKTSEATLVVCDPKFTFTDSHLTETGLRQTVIAIWLGYGNDMGAPVFRGKFASHEHDGQLATFRFHDLGAKMKQEKKTRYHNRKTDFGILRDVAAEHGLNFMLHGDAPDSEPHDSLIQRGVTDWAFARTIARRAGLRMWVDGSTLHAEEAGKTGRGGVTIRYLEDFLLIRPVSLSYRLPENRRGRPGAVGVRTRGAGGTQLEGRDGDGTRGNTHLGVKEDLTHHTQRAAERRARAKRAALREGAFEHRIRLLPAYRGLRVGLRGSVNLENVGRFYGGTYIAHEMVIDFRPGALVDELTLRRDIEKPKAKKGARRKR